MVIILSQLIHLAAFYTEIESRGLFRAEKMGSLLEQTVLDPVRSLARQGGDLADDERNLPVLRAATFGEPWIQALSPLVSGLFAIRVCRD